MATLWSELEKKINMIYLVVGQLGLSYLFSLAVYVAYGLIMK
jgi:hypothetical protein